MASSKKYKGTHSRAADLLFEALRKEVGVNTHAPEEDRVNEHIMARTTMYIRLGWLTDTQAKALAECLLDWYPAAVTEVWNARP